MTRLSTKTTKVLLDTNILLDIFLDRDPLNHSENILNAIQNRDLDGYIAAHTIPTIYYFLQKAYSPSKCQDAIQNTISILQVGELTHKVIASALKLHFTDFEDAIVSEIAHRESCDYIVTNNAKDFKKSICPAITPKKLLPLL